MRAAAVLGVEVDTGPVAFPDLSRRCERSAECLALGRREAVIVGAACLYGEGIITPVISVLSAYEGLAIATKTLKPAIVPLTFVTLFALFWFQSRGTARVGKAFGPIMVVWFLTIGAVGLYWILAHPQVLP